MKKNENSYLRIGTSYFKIAKMPTSTGFIDVRLPWSIDAIKQDETRDKVSNIPKYAGFCLIPEHIGYRQIIGEFLNEYHDLPFSPSAGKCDIILKFLKHIFEEHYEYCLDYFSILYKKPTQALPIILLVSKSRGTGKTTFLNLCKAIFGNNVTFNDNSSFRSQFNQDWTSKLLICVDETFLDKQEDSERMKNLATAKEVKNEGKGKDKVSQSFFGKFVLCSNNEERPIIIGDGETRYWVRKVNRFEKWDDSLLDKMMIQIPQFLNFISTREIKAANESRMWFNPNSLQTEALKRIIRYSKPRLELELAVVLFEIMEDKNLFELNGTLENFFTLSIKSNLRADRSSIKKILSDDWLLLPAPNSLTYTYYTYSSDGFLAELKGVGRFYTIKRDLIIEKI